MRRVFNSVDTKAQSQCDLMKRLEKILARNAIGQRIVPIKNDNDDLEIVGVVARFAPRNARDRGAARVLRASSQDPRGEWI